MLPDNNKLASER